MSNIMAVILDGIAQLEYDRLKSLPDHQLLYLEKMDEKMQQGIQVGDEIISDPDLNQRTQFVAGNLAHAILNDQESVASALCSYLAVRLPDLKQIKINKISTDSGKADDQISIEFVFDDEYQKQIPVKFLH